MKNLFAIIFALALPCILSAQVNYNENYPIKSSKTLEIEYQYGDIRIEKHSENEVLVEGSIYVNGESASDKFKFDITQNTGKLHLMAEANFEDSDRRLTIVMNDGTKIYKSGKDFNWDNYSDEEGVDKVYNGVDVDATFLIKVPENMDLEVNSTYGSVEINAYWDKMKIHSTYGSVDVVITNPPSTPDFKVSSTYSDVDLTLPQDANANLRMTTGYGRIYTDMKLETNVGKGGKSTDFGEDISAKLNKGAGSISLDARYSNVYLRKSKS